MKNLLVSAIFLCTIFAVAPYTGIANEAETAEQTQIAFLVEMIEKLQSQLSELLNKKGLSQTVLPKIEENLLLPVDYCPNIDRVLERGISGNDVKELQEFLRSTGDYTYSESTGYYGQLTETAVKNFQKRASIVSSGDAITTGYGVFGPLTNKALYRYCTPDPGPVACTMDYDPVCGQPPVPPTPPCVEGQLCAVYDQPLPKTYSNKCHMSVAGADYLYSGECRAPGDDTIPDNCKVWYDGCNTCSRTEPDGIATCTLAVCFAHGTPYCKAYFDDDTNKPPVISSISGPIMLEVGEVGEWKIEASDPENDSLTYSITWDDRLYKAMNSLDEGTTAEDEFFQTTTFEHSYSSYGTYVVTVSVKDAFGNVVKTSSTVLVVLEEDSIACTMEYDPVCGQPPMPKCPAGLSCIQAMPAPKTYSNKCVMAAAKATLIHTGACENTDIIHQPQLQ